uniref:Uncharacterized protein n=1 Tax=Anguilla anguilla TaxID=7936 RepID=A0A0E9U3C5_ANGAN
MFSGQPVELCDKLRGLMYKHGTRNTDQQAWTLVSLVIVAVTLASGY